MRTIRPWQIFELVPERDAWNRLIQLKLPLRRIHTHDDGSLRLLETAILLAVARATKAQRFFEFGTFCGSTTFNIATNFPDATVFTFDMDEETAKAQSNGWGLEFAELRKQMPLEFTHSPAEQNIKQLHGNSRAYDFSPFADKIDLVLCDGDRAYPEAARDTLSALRMLRENGTIFWHDYNTPVHPDHTKYLNGLSEDFPLWHIADTTLCMYLSNRDLQIKLEQTL